MSSGLDVKSWKIWCSAFECISSVLLLDKISSSLMLSTEERKQDVQDAELVR